MLLDTALYDDIIEILWHFDCPAWNNHSYDNQTGKAEQGLIVIKKKMAAWDRLTRKLVLI